MTYVTATLKSPFETKVTQIVVTSKTTKKTEVKKITVGVKA